MLVWRSKKKYKSPYTGKEVDESVGKGSKLPKITAADAGKILSVDSEGNISAVTPTPTHLYEHYFSFAEGSFHIITDRAEPYDVSSFSRWLKENYTGDSFRPDSPLNISYSNTTNVENNIVFTQLTRIQGSFDNSYITVSSARHFIRIDLVSGEVSFPAVQYFNQQKQTVTSSVRQII